MKKKTALFLTAAAALASSTRPGRTFSVYGDGNLIYTATITYGAETVFFDIPLAGVPQLRVELVRDDKMSFGALSDCGFYLA